LDQGTRRGTFHCCFLNLLLLLLLLLLPQAFAKYYMTFTVNKIDQGTRRNTFHCCILNLLLLLPLLLPAAVFQALHEVHQQQD
jgi:uncharacterized membrane protein YqaE (UPF0057 family)